jgi:omega-amidase
MRIALCQYDIQWENKEANKRRIGEMLEACPRRSEIDWLVFSEMSLSAFTMNTAISELTDDDRAFFSALASKYRINISYGGVEDGHNNLITLDRKGNRINTYSKIHLYSFGKEDQYYKAGSKQAAFELEGIKVVPAVCFDLRFPYLFWNMAEKADVYVVIAAWPARRADHWKNLVYARAVENQCYCIGVNRTGKEGRIEFSGDSVCYDPLGKVVVDAGNKDGIFVADVPMDAALVAKTRERFPFMKERKSFPWN